MRSILVFFVVAVMVVSSLSYATTINVPSEQPTIQAGIDAAFDGDSVLVDSGTYNENLDFLGKRILVSSIDGPGITNIVAADQNMSAIYFTSAEPKGAEIRGFTISGSNMSAIRCIGSSATIRGNVITDNHSEDNAKAGAIDLNNTTQTLIVSNVIHGNTATYGAAIHIGENEGFSEYDTICYNLLYDNYGYGDIRVLGSVTDLSVYNNTISVTTYDGIQNLSSGVVNARNNIIFFAPNYGMQGAGIIAEYNCTFANTADYSFTPGIGNIYDYAMFSDSASGDYSLLSDSPCIDAGDPDPQYNDPDGSRNDMGAIYYNQSLNVFDIPDQTIAEGDGFVVIVLDDYVEDSLFADDEIQWAYTGNSDLSVTIDPDRVAAISVPHPDWFGEEIITFRGTNPFGGWDSDPATFTVTPVNDAPVVDIPDQVVRHHRQFPLLPLDDFVEDIDDEDSVLVWSFSGNTVLTVDIDDERIVTITAPTPDWTGTDTVIFVAADTSSATDLDTVAFTRLENVPPEAPVLLSPTGDELVDTLFPVLTIQNSYDDDDDSLIYTFEVSLNSSFYFPQTFQKKADDDTATTVIVQQILEENTRYWWRVKASDYYAESGFSEVQTFYVNVMNELPTVFSLIEPGSPAGGDVTTLTPEFVWMLSTDPDPFDAISYTLFVAIDSNFSFVVSTSGITDTSHVIGYELLWETDYWWKVKALDLHEGTTWSSEVFRFQPIPWTCGDADGSLVIEISDAVYLINYIFIPESPAPNPYESGDADCTGVVEISDAVYLIYYIFIPGSPEPCDPDGDGEPDC